MNQDLRQARATIQSLVRAVIDLSASPPVLRAALLALLVDWEYLAIQPNTEELQPVSLDQFFCNAAHCDHENQSI